MSHLQPSNGMAPKQAAITSSLQSYRCRTRPYDNACNLDHTGDSFLQVKAKDAGDAIRRARLIAERGTIVMEAERLDG